MILKNYLLFKFLHPSLIQVYKDTKCLSRWKAKVPNLTNILREVFDREENADKNVEFDAQTLQTEESEMEVNLNEDGMKECGGKKISVHRSGSKNTDIQGFEKKISPSKKCKDGKSYQKDSSYRGIRNKRDSFDRFCKFLEKGGKKPFDNEASNAGRENSEDEILKRMQRRLEEASGPRKLLEKLQRIWGLKSGLKEDSTSEQETSSQSSLSDQSLTETEDNEFDRTRSDVFDYNRNNSFLDTSFYDDVRERLFVEREALIRRRTEEIEKYKVETPPPEPEEIVQEVVVEEEKKKVKKKSSRIKGK